MTPRDKNSSSLSSTSDQVRAGASPGASPLAFEFCVCAAIRLADGRIIRGHRHDDCIQTALKWGVQPTRHSDVQGFVTSRNRFVDRKEGMAIQQAAGIESIVGYRGEILFSEDLY